MIGGDRLPRGVHGENPFAGPIGQIGLRWQMRLLRLLLVALWSWTHAQVLAQSRHTSGAVPQPSNVSSTSPAMSAALSGSATVPNATVANTTATPSSTAPPTPLFPPLPNGFVNPLPQGSMLGVRIVI